MTTRTQIEHAAIIGEYMRKLCKVMIQKRHPLIKAGTYANWHAPSNRLYINLRDYEGVDIYFAFPRDFAGYALRVEDKRERPEAAKEKTQRLAAANIQRIWGEQVAELGDLIFDLLERNAKINAKVIDNTTPKH